MACMRLREQLEGRYRPVSTFCSAKKRVWHPRRSCLARFHKAEGIERNRLVYFAAIPPDASPDDLKILDGFKEGAGKESFAAASISVPERPASSRALRRLRRRWPGNRSFCLILTFAFGQRATTCGKSASPSVASSIPEADSINYSLQYAINSTDKAWRFSL